jgi:hypothetical protein
MTLTTIKKTAPLALLAVMLSGTALAGKGENNGKNPRACPPDEQCDKSGPKGSLDLTVHCRINDDIYDPVISVDLTIIDASDDEPLPEGTVIAPSAGAVRKNGGPTWYGFGSKQALVYDSVNEIWETDLHLCWLDPSIEDYKAASAVVNVTIENADYSETTFSANCEEFYEDGDGDGMDDMDNSNFNIRELYIDCPGYPTAP